MFVFKVSLTIPTDCKQLKKEGNLFPWKVTDSKYVSYSESL